MTTLLGKRKVQSIHNVNSNRHQDGSKEHPVLIDIEDIVEKEDMSHVEIEEPELCIFCLDLLKSSSIRSSLLCVHTFHKDCIDFWLAKSFENPESEKNDTGCFPKCPICRCEWISFLK